QASFTLQLKLVIVPFVATSAASGMVALKATTADALIPRTTGAARTSTTAVAGALVMPASSVTTSEKTYLPGLSGPAVSGCTVSVGSGPGTSCGPDNN